MVLVCHIVLSHKFTEALQVSSVHLSPAWYAPMGSQASQAWWARGSRGTEAVSPGVSGTGEPIFCCVAFFQMARHRGQGFTPAALGPTSPPGPECRMGFAVLESSLRK